MIQRLLRHRLSVLWLRMKLQLLLLLLLLLLRKCAEARTSRSVSISHRRLSVVGFRLLADRNSSGLQVLDSFDGQHQALLVAEFIDPNILQILDRNLDDIVDRRKPLDVQMLEVLRKFHAMKPLFERKLQKETFGILKCITDVVIVKI